MPGGESTKVKIGTGTMMGHRLPYLPGKREICGLSPSCGRLSFFWSGPTFSSMGILSEYIFQVQALELHSKTNYVLICYQHLQYLGKLHHAHVPSVESVERYERLKRRQELKAQREDSDTECGGNNEDEHGVEIEGHTGSI